MKENLRKEIEFNEGVSAEIVGNVLVVKGPQGEVRRNFSHPKVTFKVEGNKIVLEANKGTKREKTIIGSFQSHIRNMVKGVAEKHVYLLKICSGHFPMNVSVSNNELQIKNFFGESVPRKVSIITGVEVKVNGTEIEVKSSDKEAAGQMAGKIEKLCVVTERDNRIFQDGCYIINKAGKEL